MARSRRGTLGTWEAIIGVGNGPDEVRIRSVDAPEDIRSCVGLFFDAFNDLHTRQGLPPEDPGDDAWIVAGLTELKISDPDLFRLAVDQDGAAAFAAAYRRENYWFLSFLFVAPRAQGKGVGRRLVEELLPEEEERTNLVLGTVVESTQPVSTGLYASYGLAPRTPMYRLSGLERPQDLPALPDGISAVPLDRKLVDACAELDRGSLGYARTQDLGAWIERLPATAYVDEQGSVQGYGFIDDIWLNPIASGGQRLSAAILRDLAERLDDPAKAKISVMGWSGALMAICLGAGMRLDSSPPFVYCSTDGRRPDPAYAPFAAYQI